MRGDRRGGRGMKRVDGHQLLREGDGDPAGQGGEVAECQPPPPVVVPPTALPYDRMLVI